jgi:hypothetical protein
MEVIEDKLLSLPFLNKTEYITLQLQKCGVKVDAIEKRMTEEEKKRSSRQTESSTR